MRPQASNRKLTQNGIDFKEIAGELFRRKSSPAPLQKALAKIFHVGAAIGRPSFLQNKNHAIVAWLKKCYADACKVNQKLTRDIFEKESSSGMEEYLQANRERARVYERELLFLWRAVCVNAAGSFRRLPLAAFDTIPPEGRLFVSPIITQIGREKKFSAEIYVCP